MPPVNPCRRHKYRPAVPGLKYCAQCQQAEKDRRAQKREWEQRYNRARGIRPAADVQAEHAAARSERIQTLQRAAEQMGRVPTLRELGELIGVNWPHNPRYQQLRQEAFNLSQAERRQMMGRYGKPVAWPRENGGVV